MIGFLVVLSITSVLMQNCIYNNVCKKILNTNDHIYRFNMIVYFVCIAFFAITLIGGTLSAFTVIMGVMFGVVTALSNLYKMRSLSTGPMHITLLITTSSMIIPSMSGIFFGEAFSLSKLLVVIILIIFIYITLDKNGTTEVKKNWLLYCCLAFIFQGGIGILQKVHQSSVYKDEAGGFLFVAFICSFIYSRLRVRHTFKELRFDTKHFVLAAVCGVFIFTMNYLNLRLSGMLPSQLFFPLVNGSAIVLSSVVSVVFFKEKLSRKQLFGLCGGIACLIGICLV